MTSSNLGLGPVMMYYGFAANIHTVSELFDKAVQELFCKKQSHDHCLNTILPKQKNASLTLRPLGHQYQQPNCLYKLFKLSFMNYCLFKFL